MAEGRDDQQPEAPRAFPGALRAWLTVAVLAVAYTLSFIDRQILSLLVDPIRADLHISDTQMSLVQGLAFALFYTAFGIPVGALADRGNRRTIIAAGVAFWSIATSAVGLATSFVQLFLARVLVGIGEATLTPSALSMISDSFPLRRRGLAMSLYTSGAYIGAGLALVIGGKAIHYAERAVPWFAALGATLRPWQVAMICVGLPGLLVALLMLCLREPQRQERSHGARPSLPQALGYIRRNGRFYIPVICVASLTATVFYAHMSWLPTFLVRQHGMAASEVGVTLGLIILVCSPAGMWAAGTMCDWRSRRGARIGGLLPLLVGTSMVIVPATCVPLLDTTQHALALSAVMVFFMAWPSALSAIVLQSVTPNEYRGVVSAVHLFAVNLVGLGIGPTAVAALSDYGFGGGRSIGPALSIVSLSAALCAAVMLIWLNLRERRR